MECRALRKREYLSDTATPMRCHFRFALRPDNIRPWQFHHIALARVVRFQPEKAPTRLMLPISRNFTVRDARISRLSPLRFSSGFRQGYRGLGIVRRDTQDDKAQASRRFCRLQDAFLRSAHYTLHFSENFLSAGGANIQAVIAGGVSAGAPVSSPL